MCFTLSSSLSAIHATAGRWPPQLPPLHSTRRCAICVLPDFSSISSRHLLFGLPFVCMLDREVHSVVILPHLLLCILATCPAHFLLRSFAVWMTSLTFIISLMVTFPDLVFGCLSPCFFGLLPVVFYIYYLNAFSRKCFHFK